VVALDASGSVGRDNFQKELDFVTQLVYGLNMNSQSAFGLMSFSTDPVANIYMNDFITKQDIMNGFSVYYR
jgi:hypothetical protein